MSELCLLDQLRKDIESHRTDFVALVVDENEAEIVKGFGNKAIDAILEEVNEFEREARERIKEIDVAENLIREQGQDSTTALILNKRKDELLRLVGEEKLLTKKPENVNKKRTSNENVISRDALLAILSEVRADGKYTWYSYDDVQDILIDLEKRIAEGMK